MKTRTILSSASTVSLLLLAACGNVVSLGGGGTGGDPSSSSSAGPTTAGSGGSTSVSGPSSVAASSSDGAGGGIDCSGGPPGQDNDADGYTIGQGDCNDCDPTVNPGAIEVQTASGDVPADENCNGAIDEPDVVCDAAFAVDDPDPIDAAHAVELCKVSSGPGSYGLVSAQWVLPDGTTLAGMNPNFDLGHGLLPAFGPNVTTRAGQRFLALSSGTARQPTDPGYQSVQGFAKGYTQNPPMGFPKESPACPGVITGTPNDGAGLEVTVRAPTNATGLQFEFNYYTYEWPMFFCSTFNDVFVAMLSPIPAGQMDGNISFDNQGNTVSVNSVFIDVCSCPSGPPCVVSGKTFDCSLGASALVGTGFGIDASNVDHGSTGWLTTTAPVQAGSEVTLRWGVYDSGDGIFDTTTLIDDWRWITSGKPAVLTYRPGP